MIIEHLLSDHLELAVFLPKKTTVTCLFLWMGKRRSLGLSRYVPGLLQRQRTAPLNVEVLIPDYKTRDAQVTQLGEGRAGIKAGPPCFQACLSLFPWPQHPDLCTVLCEKFTKNNVNIV